MAVSSDMLTAWNSVLAAQGENGSQTIWVNGIQMATGVFVRYLPAQSKLFQWNAAGGTWAQVTALAAFLAAGSITVVDTATS